MQLYLPERKTLYVLRISATLLSTLPRTYAVAALRIVKWYSWLDCLLTPFLSIFLEQQEVCYPIYSYFQEPFSLVAEGLSVRSGQQNEIKPPVRNRTLHSTLYIHTYCERVRHYCKSCNVRMKTRIESIPRSSVGLARYICCSYFKKYSKAHFLELNEL